jgi:hypothetical protein
MARGDVDLNGEGYRVVTGTHHGVEFQVQEFTTQQFLTPFTTAGRLRPEDSRTHQKFLFPNFNLGLGIDRIPSDSAFNPEMYRRFWSTTTADTRWANGVFLPLLAVAMTDGTSGDELEVIRCSATFKANFWALWEDDTSTDIIARTHDATNARWEGGGTVAASGSIQVALDVMAHKTKLMALTAFENDHKVYMSANGVDWTAAGSTVLTVALLTNNVTAHEDIDAGLLVQIGGEAVAILWEESNGQIAFFSSADIGETWTNEDVDISSGNGPQGAVVATGIDNEQKIFVFTREGIWEVDTAASQWTADMIHPMPPSPHNGRRATLHADGSIWFAQGADNDQPPSVFRMTTASGQRIIQQVPNDFSMHDGLGTAELGPINWMISVPSGVVCSQGGGAASRNARIWQHNGHGWHSLHKNSTANERIEWIGATADDSSSGTALFPRLVFAVRDAADDSDTYYLDEPWVNPSSGVTISRRASGIVSVPYMDAGLPFDSGTWLRVAVNAENLTQTSGEYINLDYGVTADLGTLTLRNGADLGNIVSDNRSILLPSTAGGGDGGAGQAGHILGLEVVLHRDGGDVTQTPVLKDLEVAVIKPTGTLRGFSFTIDIAESGKVGPGGKSAPPEVVRARIEAARDLGYLPSLRIAGAAGVYVRVTSIEWYMSLQDAAARSAPNALSQRAGYAVVTCEEVI